MYEKSFLADKFVSDIADNQVLLLNAIDELRQAGNKYLTFRGRHPAVHKIWRE